MCLVVLATILACFAGMCAPLCGTFMMLVTFGLYVPDEELGPKGTVDPFSALMFALAVGMCVLKIGQRVCFSLVAENMTIEIRKELYLSFLRKHIGWHDDKDNSSGVLSSMLAGDVQTLNGASSEAFATTLEAAFALLWAVAIGFYYSWPLATVFMILLPLMMLGAALGARHDSKGFNTSEETKHASRLAADAIANYKTI